MALSAVSSSSSSVLDSGLVATLIGNTNQAALSSINSASTAGGNSSGSSTDTLAQDMVEILKALALGDNSGAKSGLAKLRADLKAETATDETGSSLTKDVTSLLKDLTSGNTSAAKTDVTKLQADLKTEDSSSYSNPLETLVGKIADSLSSGSIQAALKDLTSYLVQNGQFIGGLVNTTA